MTLKELLSRQLLDSDYQLRKATEGLSAELSILKPLDTGMSVQETLVHLAECYEACKAALAGEKFEWGKFDIGTTDWEEIQVKTFTLRSSAIEAVQNHADEDLAVTTASDYMVGHDYYHVGQLCATRMAIEPEWDAMSIYNF